MAASPSLSDVLHLTIICKPFRKHAVLEALVAQGVADISWQEVRGYGRQKGHLELYRGSEYDISFLPKVKIRASCGREARGNVIRAVCEAARTGRIGDGKIFITRRRDL